MSGSRLAADTLLPDIRLDQLLLHAISTILQPFLISQLSLSVAQVLSVYELLFFFFFCFSSQGNELGGADFIMLMK